MASGVEFDEDNVTYARPAARPGMPMQQGGYSSGRGMAGWLMRHGFAKSNTSAQIVMIGVVVVNAIIIFILIKFFI